MKARPKIAPAPPRLLRGSLLIEETPAVDPPNSRYIAKGLHPDGTPFRVYATLSDLTIHLITPGRSVRRVSLSCLIEAINNARKLPPQRKRGPR